MRRVRRDEILDWQTYDDGRERFRAEVFEVKRPRRVQLGAHLTLLFENTFTIRYQIQEMIRAERIVREADVIHEIATYNEILGGPGVLGCTLLIGIDDPELRARKLREWWAIPERVYVVTPDGARVYAAFDPRQRGDDRVSSVQYLTFDVCGTPPVAAGVDLPGLVEEVTLSDEQRRALAADLAAPEHEG